MSDRLKAWADRLKEVEPLKALVFSLLAGTFGVGVAYARLDGQITNAAADILGEKAARKDGEKATKDRIDRGFDKVLNALSDMRKTLDQKAETDRQTAYELGKLRGLYERNYGDIPADERPH